DFSDDNILELGYGRGNGLQYCFDRVVDGDGAVFGIDRSSYMEDCARHRFVLELAETTKIQLDHAPDLRDLPYPPAVFNHIFHVDLYYFIHQDHMFDICKELRRVLKPGGTMVCGMHFGRLKKLTKWGILNETQWDPMRYLMCLEPAGFTDVKVDYKSHNKAGEYQLVSCRRPISDEIAVRSSVKVACTGIGGSRRCNEATGIANQKEMLISDLMKSKRKLTKEELSILNEELPVGQAKKS
ncbi:methyltransferase domain protein, partial [Ostertagia ostertagi]